MDLYNRLIKLESSKDFPTDFHCTKKEGNFLTAVSQGVNNYYSGMVTLDENSVYINNGEYLYKYNEELEKRFNELTTHSIMIVDREFMENNELPQFTKSGKRKRIREVLMVDFELSLKSNARTCYSDCMIFKDYLSLISYIEGRNKNKIVFVMGKDALLNMRFVIKDLQITTINNLKLEGDNLVQFPLEKYEIHQSLRLYNKEDIANESEIKAIQESEYIEPKRKKVNSLKELNKLFGIVEDEEPKKEIKGTYRHKQIKRMPRLRTFFRYDTKFIEENSDYNDVNPFVGFFKDHTGRYLFEFNTITKKITQCHIFDDFFNNEHLIRENMSYSQNLRINICDIKKFALPLGELENVTNALWCKQIQLLTLKK